MLFDGFMIAGTIICALSVVVGLVTTVVSNYPSDSAIVSLGLVEVYLIVYGIAAGVRQGTGSAPLIGAGWEFWGYLVTAFMLVILAGWWAIGESSRWSNIIMAATGFTVFVMLYRMQQVWMGLGWF
ncbi:MAG: hypothetical protein ACTII7_02725 [Galactobacter sp.]